MTETEVRWRKGIHWIGGGEAAYCQVRSWAHPAPDCLCRFSGRVQMCPARIQMCPIPAFPGDAIMDQIQKLLPASMHSTNELHPHSPNTQKTIWEERLRNKGPSFFLQPCTGTAARSTAACSLKPQRLKPQNHIHNMYLPVEDGHWENGNYTKKQSKTPCLL